MTSPRTEAQGTLRHYFQQALGDLSPDQRSEIDDIVDQIIAAALIQARQEARAPATVGPILDLLQADPHQWSTRPCPTCRSITALAGVPFGCDLYRQRQRSAVRK